MLDQSRLLEANPSLGLLNDIYQDTSNVFRESSLSNYIQIAVSDIFHAAKDKSLFSLDIQRLLTTDELRSTLDFSQYNFLQCIQLDGVNHVLDLSEDLGGVAHYLADFVSTVDSIKVDCDRSRLSLLRCANNHNICHISEDLDKLEFPAKHYDLIIVSSLEALELSKAMQSELLSRLQKALSEHGVIVIGAANRDRISKWLDKTSSSSVDAVPYQELYSSDHDREYDRRELLDTVSGAGFAATTFYTTFSKANGCQNLFSEDYLTSNLNALNHFYRIGAIENSELNEYLLFKGLHDERERIFDCGSRYLVFAGNSTKHTRRVYNNDFAHFAGTGRQAHWRTITARVCGSAVVSKTSIYPKLIAALKADADSSLKVSQNLDEQPFRKGKLLVEDWLTAIVNNEAGSFRELVHEYSSWLQNRAEQGEFTASAYDLLPFNVVVAERGDQRDFQAIDVEWQIEGDFDVTFVVFRALFWFAFENKPLLRRFAQQNDISSIASFIVQFLPEIGLIAELQPFAETEERIQSQIDNQFRAKAVSHALLQTFNGDDVVEDSQLRCQILWGDRNGVMDEEASQFANWQDTGSPASLSISMPGFSIDKPILRIDPIASKGIFNLLKIDIQNESNESIWCLDSSQSIADSARIENAEDIGRGFIALNDDPYLLFDLADVENIQDAKTVQLEIQLLQDDNYDAALATLTQAVADQNVALIRQQNTLNQYRSELEYTKLRLEDAIEHRSDLNTMLQDLDKEKRQQIHKLNVRLSHLNEQLVAQLGRNEEMEGYLMMRPSTRAKRFAARSLGRLTGKDPDAEAEAEAQRIAEAEAREKEKKEDPNRVPDTGELIGQNTEDYQLWIRENTLTEDEIAVAKKEIEDFEIKPVFSILVPIYNTDPEYLIPMIRSVQAQIYPHWQLCLVDDASPKGYLKQILEYEAAQDSRISIQLNDNNQGISLCTNDALNLATGDYIGLLDHDDELSIDALYENAKAINQFPDLGLAYSDEDKMDMQGNRLEPYFKPDYSPDLLDTNNYVCHFTVIKKSIADEIGGFREGLDGSQDHDIILRAIQQSERVVHIPRILYHWRKIPGSTAVVYDSKSYAWEAGRRAVENCLKKQEQGVRVEFGSLKGTYRVFREIQGDPLISIVIPFKDKPELLDSCLESILARSTYANFEIIGVSNNSEDPATFARMEHFKELDSRVSFVEKNIPFNFSAICNYGVSQANGDYVLLLNNDIEIQSPDWLERLLEHAQRPGIGAVGGKLLFPDGRIQHAGVVAGMVGAAGHPHKFFPDNHIGYHGRLHMVYNVSAVTGAMMMISKAKYEEVGGLDEENLAVAYNDIDLCLKLLDKGYLNVFTPHCKAIHHESISRGYEDTEEKLARLKREQQHFLTTWQDFLEKGDPFYNPNLSLKNERFSLNFRD